MFRSLVDLGLGVVLIAPLSVCGCFKGPPSAPTSAKSIPTSVETQDKPHAQQETQAAKAEYEIQEWSVTDQSGTPTLQVTVRFPASMFGDAGAINDASSALGRLAVVSARVYGQNNQDAFTIVFSNGSKVRSGNAKVVLVASDGSPIQPLGTEYPVTPIYVDVTTFYEVDAQTTDSGNPKFQYEERVPIKLANGKRK